MLDVTFDGHIWNIRRVSGECAQWKSRDVPDAALPAASAEAPMMSPGTIFGLVTGPTSPPNKEAKRLRSDGSCQSRQMRLLFIESVTWRRRNSKIMSVWKPGLYSIPSIALKVMILKPKHSLVM